MSARMPRILRLPALGLSEFSHHSQETLMSRVELGLELGRVSPRVALEHFSVVCHDLVAVFLDVTDRDFDLPRAEVERYCDHIAMPASVVIIEDVVNGDSRANDSGPRPRSMILLRASFGPQSVKPDVRHRSHDPAGASDRRSPRRSPSALASEGIRALRAHSERRRPTVGHSCGDPSGARGDPRTTRMPMPRVTKAGSPRHPRKPRE